VRFRFTARTVARKILSRRKPTAAGIAAVACAPSGYATGEPEASG